MIEHFNRLGVTAVELMPVHTARSRLVANGGCVTTGVTTPSVFSRPISATSPAGPRSGGPRVQDDGAKALHAAGIEVILDVVYNHTAEGTSSGPTLSFRGIDNAAYYRLVPDNPRYYMDYHRHRQHPQRAASPRAPTHHGQLRYWVVEMHVDGFRFDLAAALARESTRSTSSRPSSTSFSRTP